MTLLSPPHLPGLNHAVYILIHVPQDVDGSPPYWITGTGVELTVVVPSPSWPEPFAPQQ